MPNKPTKKSSSRAGWAKAGAKTRKANQRLAERRANAKKQAEAAPAEPRNRRSMEQVILDLCQASSRSVDPVRVARAFAEDRGEEDPMAWRRWLHQVRSTAIGMARKGEIHILRKGKPADPEDFRGVYRLGLPGRAEAGPDVEGDEETGEA